MDLDGVRLVRANLQPVTVLRVPGRPFRTFVFLKPDGMDELTFHFEGDIQDVTVGKADFERFMVRDAAEIVCVTRALAGRMTVLDGGLAFVDEAVYKRQVLDRGRRLPPHLHDHLRRS